MKTLVTKLDNLLPGIRMLSQQTQMGELAVGLQSRSFRSMVSKPLSSESTKKKMTMSSTLRPASCLSMGSRVCTINHDLNTVAPARGLATSSRSSLINQESAESIFNLIREGTEETINVGKLLKIIKDAGIRTSDVRLTKLMSGLKKYQEEVIKKQHFDSLSIDLETFKRIAEPNIFFISRILRNDLIIPEFQQFSDNLTEIYLRCKSNNEGAVASYIPQLARYSPDYWAVSACTVDGQRFAKGDVKKHFTIQSCSKPFTYAICLNELGAELVHGYVGQEPSGRNFNEICLDSSSKPHNPMLNSGAIMCCSLILEMVNPGQGIAEKYDYLLKYMKTIAGGEYLGFNNSVFLSERMTADRNFAMAYYMKEYRCFPPNTYIHDSLDLYFQTCSMEVDTESLSLMAATLANGGICPTTGQRVLRPDAVRDVLSLMFTCGMYNYSGQFAFKVGLPAKSGVSGCVVLVVPNVMGVALWSPPLDSIGNSVRGLQFSEELVQKYNFHRFDNLLHSEEKTDPRKSDHQSRSVNTLTLLFSAASGNVTALQRYYLEGHSMEVMDYDGRTALHLAAAEGQLDAVNFLLHKCNVNPNPIDRWGHTPITEAERRGHTGIQDALKNAIENKSKT